MDALDQPVSGANLFLEILARLFFRRSFLAGQASIERIDTQPRYAVVVQKNDIFVADFLDKNIRQYRPHLVLLEAARRFGLQGGNEMSGLGNFVDGNA